MIVIAFLIIVCGAIMSLGEMTESPMLFGAGLFGAVSFVTMAFIVA